MAILNEQEKPHTDTNLSSPLLKTVLNIGENIRNTKWYEKKQYLGQIQRSEERCNTLGWELVVIKHAIQYPLTQRS